MFYRFFYLFSFLRLILARVHSILANRVFFSEHVNRDFLENFVENFVEKF